MEDWLSDITDWVSLASGLMTILGIGGLLTFRRSRNSGEITQARRHFVGGFRAFFIAGIAGLATYFSFENNFEPGTYLFFVSLSFIGLGLRAWLYAGVAWVEGE